MSYTLRYGRNATLELPLGVRAVTDADHAREAAVDDVRQATRDALAAPVEYPPLSQALVEGDHVTIAVDRLVPAAGEVVAGLLEFFGEAGVPADAITVLFSDPRDAAALRGVRVAATVPSGDGARKPVHVEVHDPDDRGKLSYIANTASGKPIYLNRAVGDADLVVTVGASHGRTSWSYRGPYGGIYPTFSDAAARSRFRNPALLNPADETFRKSQEEVEAVAWKSGVQFTVQVVPGAGDGVAAVVAGELGATAREAARRHASLHRAATDRRVRTVIAALTGEAAQTWDRFALALDAALAAVDDGGVVVLCTELAEPLGPALELLSQIEDDRDPALAHIRKQRPADMFAALQLNEAQRRVRVHLLSRLDADLVESLGMHPIGDAADVGRLAARGGSCLVVPDAQHAIVAGPGE